MLSNQHKASESFFSLRTLFYVSQSRLLLIIYLFTILSYILMFVIRIIGPYQFSFFSYYKYFYYDGCSGTPNKSHIA